MIDIFIAGAQKAGTTSVLRYLSEHRDIVSHPQLEMSFFALDDEFNAGESLMKKKYGLKSEKGKFVLAKQANLSSDTKAIKRLYDHNPACKIMFLTREPIARAFSSYKMERKGLDSGDDFDAVIEHGLKNHDHWHYKYIIKLGCYSDLLGNLLEYFPEEQLLIIAFEDLKSNPNEVVSSLCDWLNISAIEVEGVAHNSKESVSLSPVRKLIGDNSMLKSMVIKLLGYRTAHKLASQLSKLIHNPASVVEESLSDYPKAKAELSRFYAEYNEDLKKWGIKYSL